MVSYSTFPITRKLELYQYKPTRYALGLDGDIGYSKPDGFYVNKGLRTINNNITPHILENHIFNDRYKDNWARYSFHLKTWEPSSDGDTGDTLITLLEALTIGFFVLADETDNGVKYE